MPVLRILAADVLALERTSSTAWTLRGHLVAIVQLTGMVVEAAASGKRLLVHLDDGSGVSIPVIQWLPRNLANADPVEFARCVNVPALGTYLSVTGKISEHRGERQIVASHIETLNDGLSAGILDVLLALRSRKILAVTKPKPAAVHALQQALLDPERRKKWQGRHILAFHTLIRDDHIVGLVRALQQPDPDEFVLSDALHEMVADQVLEVVDLAHGLFGIVAQPERKSKYVHTYLH